MTPEGKVKAAIKKMLETSHVYFFMPSANGYGRSGIPDFVACINSHFLAIEAKGGGGTTTALQERELQRIRAAGGVALVINENNLQVLQDALEERR